MESFREIMSSLARLLDRLPGPTPPGPGVVMWLVGLLTAVSLGIGASLLVRLAEGGGRAEPIQASLVDCPTPCPATLESLGRGRQTVVAPAGGGPVTIRMVLPQVCADCVAAVQVGRSSRPLLLTIRPAADAPGDTLAVPAWEWGQIVHRLVTLPAVDTVELTLAEAGPAPSARLVVADIGLYRRDQAPDAGVPAWLGLSPVGYYGKALPRTVFLMAALGLAGLWRLRRHRRAGALAALFVFGIALAGSSLTATNFYLPGAAPDLRSAMGEIAYAGDGGNLSDGLYMGANVLAGHGPVQGPGAPAWHRMPGYGLFTALAGLAGGAADVYGIGIATVFAQIAFTALAVTVLFLGALQLFSLPVAAVLATGCAMLPQQPYYTQGDSIIAPIAMLIVAAACGVLAHRRDDRPVPLGWFALLHGGFALWLSVRSDPLPGWIVVSLVLHWRSWRHLVIPALMISAVCGSWGAFKYQFTGEFVPTTASAGHSFLTGIFEVPSRLPWQPSDHDVYAFIAQSGERPSTLSGDRFASREAARFLMTYPGYAVSLVWHKLMEFVTAQAWPGFGLNSFVIPRLKGAWIWGFFAVMALSLATGHRRLQTFLLGWPVLLDMPLFFLVFASAGRFYSGVSVGMMAAVVPLVLDRSFYTALARQRRTAIAIIAGAILLALFGRTIDNALLRWDAFRYWSPVLDPAASKVAAPLLDTSSHLRSH
jgi:hypothetical protein